MCGDLASHRVWLFQLRSNCPFIERNGRYAFLFFSGARSPRPISNVPSRAPLKNKKGMFGGGSFYKQGTLNGVTRKVPESRAVLVVTIDFIGVSFSFTGNNHANQTFSSRAIDAS
jgi:hypothetical protein